MLVFVKKKKKINTIVLAKGFIEDLATGGVP